ncbi:polysaccharide lyase 8 family protein [Streptomyces sp. A7024]|uniref:Polysaccharide lyase 8 family protein n=1 Tax=Streptomyces coryli TaxID=1128680 RepID=A0A6G4UAH3_9ACTN|nr:polysaccharide lyase 8 family protein [Streptomyces coryli]NGN69002.1 polysaccharide lyase 8 family protein [Streptomyces coryli]
MSLVPRISRRSVLGGAAAAGAVLLAAPPASAASAAASAADEYDTLLQRAEELMTGGEFDPADPDFAAALGKLGAEAAKWWDSMDRSAGRTAVWPDLTPVSDPEKFGQSYPRLKTLATAWATPGTPLTGKAEVAQAVVDALRFLHDGGYRPDATQTGNWWFWEIGSPRAMLDTCVLLRAQVPAADLADYLATVQKWCPNADKRVVNGAIETGGNRSDKAVIVALHGLLARDAAKVASARDSLSDVAGGGKNSLFGYVTSGDGIYEDGSLIQHGTVAYTGTYGNVLLAGTAHILALLGGSTWKVTDPKVSVIFDAIERAFSPVVFDGLMMDTQNGRAVSRVKANDATNGAATISNMLLLALGAPAGHAARWRALAKGWITRNKAVPYLAAAAIPQLTRARAVLDDAAVPAAPRLTGAHVFADMDRVVQRRPGWALSLGLSSARVAAYECGNFENKKAWYQGDGTTYVYVPDDLAHYGDAYWATVNPYRLPGTTVDTRERAKVGDAAGTKIYQPKNRTAGGAALGKRYAAAAMDLIADGSTLRAKKAWFTFDGAVIALGAGITSSDGRTIETIVENRHLHASGTNRLLVDGAAQPGTQGWSKSFAGAGWAHLQGTGGYVFPGKAAIRALREERTGNWADINTGADTGGTADPITRRYVTLWCDHGKSPADATYAYVLLPGASAATTAAWAAANPVSIVANSPTVQAVESRRDGVLAAHFWAEGSAAGLRCSGSATVLVQRRDDGIEVAVADSSRTQETVRIELPFPATKVVSADDTVSVETGRRPVLTVKTAGSRGHTHAAKLA